MENGAPIFCDNDPRLAMARMDGAVLCVECIMEAYRQPGGAEILGSITPLDVRAGTGFHPIKDARVTLGKRLGQLGPFSIEPGNSF